MKNLTFENIAKACEGEYIGDEALLSDRIKGAVIDSRLVEEGCKQCGLNREALSADGAIIG